MFRTL